MRRTLRSGNPTQERPPLPPHPEGPYPKEAPGANTAASLAWGSTERRSSSGVRTPGDGSILPSFLRPRRPPPPPHLPYRDCGSRPTSPRSGGIKVGTPPLPSKARAKEPRSKSSSAPVSAAARVLRPSASPVDPAINDPDAGSDRPVSSSSKVPSGSDSVGLTRNAHHPAARRGRRHVAEEKPRRNPAMRDPADAPRQMEPAERISINDEPQIVRPARRRGKGPGSSAKPQTTSVPGSPASTEDTSPPTGESLESRVLGNLPDGIDQDAAKQLLGELVQGGEVYWEDIAGLDAAKSSLREAVVYPFLRPDLFIGLRQPACGILLFGPPGTGKTMLARAVATESRSAFFSLSASSLTSKYLGDSEKLVRALFAVARMVAPSIIFVDEIDSLLGQRSGDADHETTRRIKTEFLIQWSHLQQAVPSSDGRRGAGDANRVLVLAATNLPWAIDEAARRRFVKRQYIPLPEPTTRSSQLRRLLSQQNHTLTDHDINRLVTLTEGEYRTRPWPRREYSNSSQDTLGLTWQPSRRTLPWDPSGLWAKRCSICRSTRSGPWGRRTLRQASHPSAQASARKPCANMRNGRGNLGSGANRARECHPNQARLPSAARLAISSAPARTHHTNTYRPQG